MIHSFDSLLRTTRLLCAVILLAAIFVLASVLVSTPEKSTVHAQETRTTSRQQIRPVTDSPNVVANAMTLLAYHSTQAMDTFAATTARATNSLAQGAKTGILAAASGIRKGAAATARGTHTALVFVGRGIGSGTSLIIRAPGNALEAISGAPVISSFIRPADHAEDVPMIDPDSPELRAALAALPAEEQAHNSPNSVRSSTKPQWPVSGQITTQFGVSHWPFQHTHTGIDISDGSAPGTTAVRPFRPGTVTKSVHSAYGLGNHVIVDHGSGVTSVYAHLNSIAVQVGQEVSLNTTLGMQGTTGVSTGTHLHFEIRVNGKAANPQQFIPGRP